LGVVSFTFHRICSLPASELALTQPRRGLQAGTFIIFIFIIAIIIIIFMIIVISIIIAAKQGLSAAAEVTRRFFFARTFATSWPHSSSTARANAFSAATQARM
jgi:hypothetical protein